MTYLLGIIIAVGLPSGLFVLGWLLDYATPGKIMDEGMTYGERLFFGILLGLIVCVFFAIGMAISQAILGA